MNNDNVFMFLLFMFAAIFILIGIGIGHLITEDKCSAPDSIVVAESVLTLCPDCQEHLKELLEEYEND